MNYCCVLFVRPCSGTCCLWSARVFVTFPPVRVFGYFINHACEFLCRLLKEWCGFIYENHVENMLPFKKWNLFLAALHLEVAGTENNFSWSWGWFLCSGKFFSSPCEQPRLPPWRGLVAIRSLSVDATNWEEFWQNPGLNICLDIFHCAELERRVSVI